MFKPRRVDEHHTESFLKPLLATFQTRSPVSCSVFSGFPNWVCLKAVYIPKNLVPGTIRRYTEKTPFSDTPKWILIHIQADADIFSYTSAISACEKGGQWQQALNLFVRMTLAKLQPQLGGK
jgi:pentatricopeptide repeat protein